MFVVMVHGLVLFTVARYAINPPGRPGHRVLPLRLLECFRSGETDVSSNKPREPDGAHSIKFLQAFGDDPDCFPDVLLADNQRWSKSDSATL